MATNVNPAPWTSDATADDAVALVLAELASSRVARRLVAELAQDAGLPLDAARAALAEAERGGWCECWDADPDGPSAILSARSARWLRLHLSADGVRWLKIGQRDLSALEKRGRAGVMTDLEAEPDRPGLLADLADPDAMEGLDALVWQEQFGQEVDRIEAEQQARPVPDGLARLAGAWDGWNAALDEARLPQPHLILGLGVAWPVRWSPGDDAPCPGCGGQPLAKSACCVVCHASGLDRLLPEVAALPADPTGEPPLARRAGRVKVKRRSKAVPFADLMAALEG